MHEGEDGFQKHSEARPQGGQVYNYKALQRVAGEPAVSQTRFPTGSYFFYMYAYILMYWYDFSQHTLL